MSAMFLAIAGAIAFFALGAGVGAAKSDGITTMTSYPGDSFNWLLAILGGGALMVLAMIAGAASWIIDAIKVASTPADESPVAE